MTVHTVGIAHRDGCRGRAAGRHLAVAAVSDRPCAEVLDLQDLDLEACNRRELDAGKGADPVDADAEAHHVELKLREALDAGGVEDMSHRNVAERGGDCAYAFGIERNLAESEIVLSGVLGHTEMRIDRLHPHFIVRGEEIKERRQFLGHEAEAVHPGVQFDMDRISLDAAAPQLRAEDLKRVDVGDARFEPVVDDLGKEIRTCGKDQDRQRDAACAQFHPFHRQGHSKVVGAFSLHHGGEFDGTVAVCIGLDQNKKFGGVLQLRTEIAVVLPASLQVELQP